MISSVIQFATLSIILLKLYHIPMAFATTKPWFHGLLGGQNSPVYEHIISAGKPIFIQKISFTKATSAMRNCMITRYNFMLLAPNLARTGFALAKLFIPLYNKKAYHGRGIWLVVHFLDGHHPAGSHGVEGGSPWGAFWSLIFDVKRRSL